MRPLIVLFAAAACLTTGCLSSNTPLRGWIPQASVGQPYTDFSFIDEKGSTRSLRELLGDYTVLLFTKCEINTHESSLLLLADIVAENHRGLGVHVFGVSIHNFDMASGHEDRCMLISQQKDVAMIHDRTGGVHKLYSAPSRDWLYVIDPAGHIILSSPADSPYQLRKQLKQEVTRLSQKRESGHPGRGYRGVR